jgi:hypothetical protein
MANQQPVQYRTDCFRVFLHSINEPDFQLRKSTVKELYEMHRLPKYLSSFLLTAALVGPAAIGVSARQQDSHQGVDSRRDTRGNGDNRETRRVYDENRRDWHEWNDNEEHSYRAYLTERHRDYRDFFQVDARGQRDYWTWRHSHPDGNQGGVGITLRFFDQNRSNWHEWNDSEDRAYRQFLGENHTAYVEFSAGGFQLQEEYWNWRSSHPDNDQGRNHVRYYDQSSRDWHDWDYNEDTAYRQFLTERRRNYHDFSQADVREQREYWQWRHSHPDGNRYKH